MKSLYPSLQEDQSPMTFCCFFYSGIFLLLFSSTINAETEEEAFLKSQALTDQQLNTSRDYLHMGLHDKKVKEICGEDQSNAYCRGDASAWEQGTMGATFERMIPVAASMYSMMMMTGSNKISYQEDRHSKESMDICGLAPMGTQIAAKATAEGMLKHTNKQAENKSTGFRQIDALHATAKTHEENEKMSKVQAWGWGLAAGCYAATLSYGTFENSLKVEFTNTDKNKLATKLAGATLLAFFYKRKAKVHKEHIEAINQAIAKFPKKGDCNPFTQTLCFCREESSKTMDPENYMKVCLPKDYGKKSRMFAPLSCVDQHKKPDPSCKCNQTNSCITRLFMNDLKNLPANSTAMQSTAQQLNALAAGKYDVAKMEAATDKSLAMARKVFNETIDQITDIPTTKKPTEAELTRFNDLKKYGIPASLAKHIAQTNPSPGLSFFNANHPGKTKLSAKIKDKTKKFKHIYGNPPRKIRKPRTVRRNTFSPFNMPKGGANPQGGVQVMEYADKAMREAQIRSDRGDSSSIFDVISHRYQKSAWEVFPMEENEDQLE